MLTDNRGFSKSVKSRRSAPFFVQFSTLVAFGLLLHIPPLAASEAGLILAQKVYDRPEGKDVSSRTVMILAEKGHSPRTREFFSYAIDKGGGERLSLVRFSKPADVKGTGLLTVDYPGDNTDQWIFLPALDRVRRISSSRKGGRFVGSDLFYEDMQDREVDMDHHKLLGKGKVGGIKCDILLSTPVDPDNSVYSKRVSWIHPKTLLPLRVDYYKKREKKPFKRMRARKIKKIQGYWTVMDTTMYDLKSGHKTQLITKAIKFDQGLPDTFFSRQALADDSREKRYRP